MTFWETPHVELTLIIYSAQLPKPKNSVYLSCTSDLRFWQPYEITAASPQPEYSGRFNEQESCSMRSYSSIGERASAEAFSRTSRIIDRITIDRFRWPTVIVWQSARCWPPWIDIANLPYALIDRAVHYIVIKDTDSRFQGHSANFSL